MKDKVEIWNDLICFIFFSFPYISVKRLRLVNQINSVCVWGCVWLCFFKVTRHLLKLFDNIADLRFKDSDRNAGEEEDEEAVAIGMYSREGEYVPFSEPCLCQGQVLKN